MYRVVFSVGAQAEIKGLERETAQRVNKKLHWLTENLELTKLRTLAGPLQGLFRLRVGHYRVIFAVDRKNKVIEVHRIQHRSKVYRDRF